MLPQLSRLFDLVDAHERFWAALAPRVYGTLAGQSLAAFRANIWDAYYDGIRTARASNAGATDAATQEQIARAGTARLIELRDEAAESYDLPVPALTAADKRALSTEMGGAIVGAHRSATEAQIDRETDRRFYTETNGDPSVPLDPRNDFDKPLINRWLTIRYQIAQEVAAANAAPARGRVTVTREQEDNPLSRADFDAAQVTSSGGHHGGGGGHRGYGGRRRGWGGWGGWGYDAPVVYVEPYSDADDSDPDYDSDSDPNDADPVTVQGARTMSTSPALARLLHVFSPGANGFTVAVKHDPTPGSSLVEITVCVDGRCYKRMLDVAGLARAIAAEVNLAADALAPQAGAAPAAVVQGAGLALMGADMQIAHDAVVGALLDEHAATISAGWFDSVENAVKGTLNALKGPITTAASAAAGAAALAIPGAGPLIAPMASKLTGDLINAAAGSGSTKTAAAHAVAQAKAIAQRDPRVQQALAIAHQAAAKTAAAYHVINTVGQAAQGVPGAAQMVAELHQAAASGDVGAQQAIQFVGAVDDQAKANGGDGVAQDGNDGGDGGTGDGGDPTTVSGASPMMTPARKRATALALETAHGGAAGAIGILIHADASGHSEPSTFGSLDDADDWLNSLPPASYEYVAIFDTADPTWPAPIEERLGGSAAVVSGSLWPWLALGTAGGIGYGLHRRRLHAKHAAAAAEIARQAAASAAAQKAADAVHGAAADVADHSGAPVHSSGAFGALAAFGAGAAADRFGPGLVAKLRAKL